MKRTGTIIKLAIFVGLASLFGVMILGSLTGPDTGTVHSYHAIFGAPDGVSGLRAGNVVKVSGVTVGKVTDIHLNNDATNVRITFTANDNQQLNTDTNAVVRYANLLGQRFLSLTQGPGPEHPTPLPHGGTIPRTQTQPAVSLTALFSGFRPIFSALTPAQVNDLTGDLVGVLQGQSGSVADLLAKTADLTSNLAGQAGTFTSVIGSLNTLFATIASHDDGVKSMLLSLQNLTATLAADGPAIGDSFAGVDSLIASVGGPNGLLTKLNNQAALQTDITDLKTLSGIAAANLPLLSQLLTSFPLAFGDFDRISQNGSFLNGYPCAVSFAVDGAVTINVGQLGAQAGLPPALQQLLGGLTVPLPVKFPAGNAGNPAKDTPVCK